MDSTIILSIQKVLRQSSKTATKIDINQDAKIFLHQLPTPIYRGGGKGGLLHYDFFTLADIHAALSRLSVKLPPVERVPRGSPHPCRGGAGGGVSIFPRRRGWSPNPAPYPAPKRGGEYLGGTPPLKRGGESRGANLTEEATDCREGKRQIAEKRRTQRFAALSPLQT